MKDYKTLFDEALKRTARLGAVAPIVAYSDQSYLTQEKHERFPYYVRDTIGELDLPDVVAQCLSIHQRLRVPLEELFGCDVFFTIGWVEYTIGSNMFEFDEQFAKELLAKKHQSGNSIQMHAWLTLPSMEIIDVSLSTSIGYVQKRPDMLGMVIAKHADELTGGMVYRPMLVGEDYLFKTGLAIRF